MHSRVSLSWMNRLTVIIASINSGAQAALGPPPDRSRAARSWYRVIVHSAAGSTATRTTSPRQRKARSSQRARHQHPARETVHAAATEVGGAQGSGGKSSGVHE